MSSIASAAVAFGAGLHSMWAYNRENYMFDVPLMQAKAFQIQALHMNRLNIFREDVRDLAAQTTDKMQSYLIVNTLKLGFIMTIYFNCDRVNEELEDRNLIELEIDLLMSSFFCCAAFWLFTSIWFSMQTVVVAQSIATKLLLQVARAPAPLCAEDVGAPTSREFERDLGAAFRLPFLGGAGRASRRSDEEGDRRGTAAPEPDLEAASAPWDVPLGMASAAPGAVSGAVGGGIDVSRILSGEQLCRVAPTTEEPHLKLMNLLRCQWAPYDLYGKIAMVLGTVNLLRGLALFALYYFRTNQCDFCVTPGGMLTYLTFSLLAWWCALFELAIPRVAHCFVFCTMMGSCLSVILLDGILDPVLRPNDEQSPWVFPLVTGLSASWEVVLAFSGVQWGDSWPAHWRASHFLNIMHAEDGPPSYPPAADRQPLQGAEGEVATSPSSASAHNSRSRAIPLLSCLDAVLASVPLCRTERKASLLARDSLREMCRAAGVRSGTPVAVDGFWLLAVGKERQKSYWVDPGAQASGPSESSSATSLPELLRAAREVEKRLRADALSWTAADAEKLAECGGHAVPDPRSFTAQFARSHSDDSTNMGVKASLMYLGGAILTSLLWFIVLAYSFWRSREPSERVESGWESLGLSTM